MKLFVFLFCLPLFSLAQPSKSEIHFFDSVRIANNFDTVYMAYYHEGDSTMSKGDQELRIITREKFSGKCEGLWVHFEKNEAIIQKIIKEYCKKILHHTAAIDYEFGDGNHETSGIYKPRLKPKL